MTYLDLSVPGWNPHVSQGNGLVSGEIDLQESMLVTPEAQGCEFPLQPIPLRNGGDEL